MCKKLIDETWYCWVPTNLGVLNYDFVTHSQIKKNFTSTSKYSKKTNSKRFYDLDLKFIIDSLPSYLTFTTESEEKPVGVITINNNDTNFEGTVILSYKESFQIEFEFNVEYNGKTKIFNVKYTIIDKNLELPKECNDTLFDTFAQIAYMIIKYSLHGDNHHHQKIDYILQVQRDKFLVKNIIDSFAKHIKNVERDIKSISFCIGHLKAINSIEEVKGYISYVNTFYELNKDEIDKDNSSFLKIKTMDNVLVSLKSSVTKKDNRFKYLDNSKTMFLTISALAISLALFLLNIHAKIAPNTLSATTFISKLNIIFEQSWYINLFFVSILIIFLLSILKRCDISSYIFYEKYPIYENFKHLSWLSLRDSSFRHILLKLVFPLSIIGISLYFLLG